MKNRLAKAIYRYFGPGFDLRARLFNVLAFGGAAGDEAAAMHVAGNRREARLYKRYKQFYGYAFYIGKKVRMPCNAIRVF